MLSPARRHILAALAMLILAGCGSRGPLYLPQPKAPPSAAPSGGAASSAPAVAPASDAQPPAEAERKKD